MRLVDIRVEVAADRSASGPEVLLAGWPAAVADIVVAKLRQRGVAARLVTPELAACDGAAVLVLGPELTTDAVSKVLAEITGRPAVLALAAGSDPDVFIGDDRLYFLTAHPPPIDDTIELLHAAWKRVTRPRSEDEDAEEERRRRVLDLLRRLGRETDLWSAVRSIAAEVRDMAGAAHARAWIFDEVNASLVAEERRESAAAGVTSYVARTGHGVTVQRLQDDPRYDIDVDGDGDDRFLAWPITLEEDRVLSVIALRRPPQAAPFGDAERKIVSWMLPLLAPALARLVLDRELEARAAERHAAIREDVARLFRGEALEQYQRGRTDEAHLLEIEPSWTRYAYRVLLALLIAALLFSALVHVDRHADGVGVVRGGRLMAVVAARDRAQLRPALPLRFEHSAQPLVVTSLSPKIIAAAEARQFLGEDGARLWTTSDPAVRIEAIVRGDEFADGVTGRVRVRLGRERLLFVWIPALRGLRG